MKMMLIGFLPILLFGLVHAQRPEITSSGISEAVEQLTGKRAHMTSEIHLLAGGYLTGPAVTLRLVRDEKASGIEAGLAAIKLLESAPAGSVVVAVLDDEKGFAVFGSTFAVLAKSHKLAGFVVDGSVRDLYDLKRLEFPTFARGTAPGSAGGHYRLEATNVPVWCGGIEVTPGDYVVADEDGVSVVPRDRYAEVVALAKKYQSDKQALLPLIEEYGSYLKAMHEREAAKQQP
jgi:regulator of RNase E activity RraA